MQVHCRTVFGGEGGRAVAKLLAGRNAAMRSPGMLKSSQLEDKDEDIFALASIFCIIFSCKSSHPHPPPTIAVTPTNTAIDDAFYMYNYEPFVEEANVMWSIHGSDRHGDSSAIIDVDMSIDAHTPFLLLQLPSNKDRSGQPLSCRSCRKLTTST
jgi:hypothetical protein